VYVQFAVATQICCLLVKIFNQAPLLKNYIQLPSVYLFTNYVLF